MSEALVPTRSDLERKLERSTRSLRELVKKGEAEGAVLLLDCSGSMASVLATGQRRIDALRQVVADVVSTLNVPLAAFGHQSMEMAEYIDQIPEPFGGTPLEAAIGFAIGERKAHVVVISDGLPNNRTAALDKAREFGGKIDAVFVGDDGTPEGLEGARFMSELAALTGGSGSTKSLVEMKQLSTHIKGLLGDGKAPVGGGVIQL